ncbi:thioredoxin reductase [Caldimonas brevitalea]|uniref:Thioredoxin reductase n=2 Tax=Caldimonas brevitalea TaxID=413882 RepID=A0A0G3BP20_9BURK|nr:thioredoxin reductase [Caldimonas brevitalea]
MKNACLTSSQSLPTEDVLVVGGGPAGAACALWCHQLGLRVRLLEAASAIGGLQLLSPYTNRWLPGLPGKTGQQVAASLQSHLDLAEVPYQVDYRVVSIRRQTTCGSWEVSDGVKRFASRYVVLATGSKPRGAGFVNSACVGVGPGLAMERIEVKGKRVAILGGGDNAYDQAAFALQRGAREVHIYCRRPPHALPILQERIPRESVYVGPFVANQQTMTVNAAAYDVIGVQFGFQACLPGALDLPTEHGYLQVDRGGAVAHMPGLFAAGEVTNYWHPCVATSYAQGVQVAKVIQAELTRGPATAFMRSREPMAA